MDYLKNVKFIKSIFHKEDFVYDDKPLFVMVGKSNVGKSSLINALANNSKIAKVGSTPGKTKAINYFLVNDSFYIVDLPGYGYSKMSLKEKENINNLTNDFLNSNSNIKHIFFIVDIRHDPSENDRQMYDWLLSTDIPCSIIANKSDKLSKLQIESSLASIRKKLFTVNEIIPFSSTTKTGVGDLINIIYKYH